MGEYPLQERYTPAGLPPRVRINLEPHARPRRRLAQLAIVAALALVAVVLALLPASAQVAATTWRSDPNGAGSLCAQLNAASGDGCFFLFDATTPAGTIPMLAVGGSTISLDFDDDVAATGGGTASVSVYRCQQVATSDHENVCQIELLPDGEEATFTGAPGAAGMEGFAPGILWVKINSRGAGVSRIRVRAF